MMGISTEEEETISKNLFPSDIVELQKLSKKMVFEIESKIDSLKGLLVSRNAHSASEVETLLIHVGGVVELVTHLANLVMYQRCIIEDTEKNLYDIGEVADEMSDLLERPGLFFALKNKADEDPFWGSDLHRLIFIIEEFCGWFQFTDKIIGEE